VGKGKRHPRLSRAQRAPRHPSPAIAGLRIIGGQYRGRRLHYSGDLRTRPMKDRLREAIFNLIGPAIQGKHALDLFAGTGALALEALSRGAERATLIEQHHPTADVIRQNAAVLGVEPQTEIVAGDVFVWFQRRFARGSRVHAGPGLADTASRFPHAQPEVSATNADMPPAMRPWVVFCSPPYDFYLDRPDEMRELIAGLMRAAPVESIFVVEADARFDFQTLPDPPAWDIRPYPPAVVGIFRKE
jgi:16S rRNA (guanine966-N2)-methyltransferase